MLFYPFVPSLDKGIKQCCLGVSVPDMNGSDALSFKVKTPTGALPLPSSSRLCLTKQYYSGSNIISLLQRTTKLIIQFIMVCIISCKTFHELQIFLFKVICDIANTTAINIILLASSNKGMPSCPMMVNILHTKCILYF